MTARNGGNPHVGPHMLGRARACVTPAAASALGSLLVAVAAFAFSEWRVRRAVARTLLPVERLHEELVELDDATDLGSRVGVPTTDDAVELLAGQINVVLDRLEASVAQRRAFIADASHELRTPLTGLRTRIELALDEPVDGELEETLRQSLDDIERLHHIVEDLFVLARLDSGSRPLREPLDLGALVEGEIARLASHVPISVKLESGIMVMANRQRLGRALLSLLANAERYAETRIDVETHVDGEEAVVEVHDDGPGIPLADRDRVFERFARLDSARSRDKGGSGLGLPIARQIAVAHGGSLYVADGTYGARLVLRVPLAR